jgi:excisionase family DNA binding protein
MDTVAYSIPQVMARLGLGRDGVYRAINEGKLPARKFGKRTLITERDIQRFLDSLPRLGDHQAATP